MFWIILLIALGLLFLVAELVLLPGVSIGALLTLLCDGAAIWIAFGRYGPLTGWIVVAIVLILSLCITLLALRSKTWERFSLSQRIESSSLHRPEEMGVRPGDRGVTHSRLAPMGQVEIAGRLFEARSTGIYVDPQQPVEVTGFENHQVIVRKIQ